MAATGKQVSAILKPNQYWAAPRPHLPCFSVEEQWAAIALYRELAKGEPVDDTRGPALSDLGEGLDLHQKIGAS